MEYLKNDICKFTPLFDIDYKIKKNLICGSLFKMKNSYRSLDKYIDGIKIITDHIKKSMSDFTFRLFIDRSIYEDSSVMQYLLSIKNIEIVVYHCYDFIRDETYHVGLFGTIVRMFPMFKFPNNDANIVIVNDIDVTIDDIIWIENTYHTLKNNNKLDKIHAFNYGILNTSNRFYFNKINNFKYLYKNNINLYTLTPKICSVKRFNKNILSKFLKETLSDDKDNNKFYSYYEYYIGTSHITSDMELFIYGVDEFFINHELIPYIVDHKIPYATHIDWDIVTTIIWSEIGINSKYNSSKRTKEEKDTLNIFKKILNVDKIKNQYQSISTMNLILKNHRKNKTNYDKLYQLYKAFILCHKNKNTKFIYTDVEYDILLPDFIGIYDISFIRFYNTHDKDIILHSLKFKEKEINELKELYNII